MEDPELIEYYRDYFLPAYADVVVFTGSKPEEVLYEIEGAFSHFMNFILDRDPTNNLNKAKSHIYRATVDCDKILFIKMKDDLDIIDLHRGAYEGPEEKLLTSLREYNERVLKARQLECEYVGSQNLTVLEEWKEALRYGRDIHEKINRSLLKKSIKADKYSGTKYWLKNIAIAVAVAATFFILGYYA